MPTAPARRRKTEPVASAFGVVEDADLKHVVHVVRYKCYPFIGIHPRHGS